MTRTEKSLHILVKSPDSNLHFLVSPEIALHLFYRMKRKRAMLRSNSPGLMPVR